MQIYSTNYFHFVVLLSLQSFLMEFIWHNSQYFITTLDNKEVHNISAFYQLWDFFLLLFCFNRQLSTLFCITFYCHSFQIDINEYLCIVIASIFLTLLFDYPFGNLKKNIFDSPKEAPKVETEKLLLDNSKIELDHNGNVCKLPTKIEWKGCRESLS